MKFNALVVFVVHAVLSACGALTREAEEFGSTEFGLVISACDGETWESNEAGEILCVRRSRENPNTFLITQDAGEYWTEKLGAFALLTLHSFYYDPTGLLEQAYSDFINDDPPSKWRKVANQYMRKHYGAKAKISEFEWLESTGGYIFEVEPGDQIPPWEEKEIPDFVLASQMPDESWREPDIRSGVLLAQLARKNRPVTVAIKSPLTSPHAPQSLTAMLERAVQTSRRPGSEAKHVEVEVLDPLAYQRYMVASGVEPETPHSLTNY